MSKHFLLCLLYHVTLTSASSSSPLASSPTPTPPAATGSCCYLLDTSLQCELVAGPGDCAGNFLANGTCPSAQCGTCSYATADTRTDGYTSCFNATSEASCPPTPFWAFSTAPVYTPGAVCPPALASTVPGACCFVDPQGLGQCVQESAGGCYARRETAFGEIPGLVSFTAGGSCGTSPNCGQCVIGTECYNSTRWNCARGTFTASWCAGPPFTAVGTCCSSIGAGGGTCTVTTQSACTGTFIACPALDQCQCSSLACYTTGGCCTGNTCTQVGTPGDCQGTFLGFGTDCSTCTPPTGSCCHVNGTCGTATFSQCFADGTPELVGWERGGSCTRSQCGGCSLEPGAVFTSVSTSTFITPTSSSTTTSVLGGVSRTCFNVTALFCSVLGGTFSNEECAPPTLYSPSQIGSCCGAFDGFGYCQEVTFEECSRNENARFVPNGNCSQLSCGACVDRGECKNATSVLFCDGTFTSGQWCGAADLPGFCCGSVGQEVPGNGAIIQYSVCLTSYGSLDVSTASACSNFGGVFNNSVPGPNRCLCRGPSFTTACCLQGTCTATSAGNCTALGGTVYPDVASCTQLIPSALGPLPVCQNTLRLPPLVPVPAPSVSQNQNPTSVPLAPSDSVPPSQSEAPSVPSAPSDSVPPSQMSLVSLSASGAMGSTSTGPVISATGSASTRATSSPTNSGCGSCLPDQTCNNGQCISAASNLFLF